MTTQEAINRGNNLAIITFISVTGIPYLSELLYEDDWPDKIDAALIFLLGVRAIIWYRSKRNKFSHSLVPTIFAFAGFLIKLLGIILEHKDKVAVVDDYWAAEFLLIITVLALWLYQKGKKQNMAISTK